LTIELGIFIGFAALAYVSSGLISKLFKNRRVARLISWTILLPLFLNLAGSFYIYLMYSSEPQRILANLPLMFSYFLVLEFTYLPASIILLIFWLVGVFAMFRKKLSGRNVPENETSKQICKVPASHS